MVPPPCVRLYGELNLNPSSSSRALSHSQVEETGHALASKSGLIRDNWSLNTRVRGKELGQARIYKFVEKHEEQSPVLIQLLPPYPSIKRQMRVSYHLIRMPVKTSTVYRPTSLVSQTNKQTPHAEETPKRGSFIKLANSSAHIISHSMIHSYTSVSVH